MVNADVSSIRSGEDTPMNDHMAIRPPASPLVMAVEKHSAATVLAVSGEIDAATADRVQARARELLDELPVALVVDLSEVKYFGSSGTTVLVLAAKCARERLIGFSVIAKPAALRVLQITNIDKTIALFTSRADALGIAVPAPRKSDAAPTEVESRHNGERADPLRLHVDQQPAQVRCVFRTDAVVVVVTGELDVDTIPEVERKLVAALWAATAPTTPTLAVVDLSGVSHLDSCGLNMLLRCNDLSHRLAVQLRLVASTRRVLRPIVVTEFESVLMIYPTLADALAPVN